MKDVKGVVIREFETKEKKGVHLSTDEGIIEVLLPKEVNMKGVKKVALLNLKECPQIFIRHYEFVEDSLLIFYPGFLVQPEEIEFDPLFTIKYVFENVQPLTYSEREFFYALRGLKDSNRFANFTAKLPKDIRAKFSFYPYIFSSSYGFFVKDVLYFGKFPVVFQNAVNKGKVLSLITKSKSYLILNENGTFEERKLISSDIKAITNNRNDFVLLVYDFFNALPSILLDSHPLFKNFKFVLDRKDVFIHSVERYLMEFRNARKFIRRALEGRIEDIPTLHLYNGESDGFCIRALIKDNELDLMRGTPYVVMEKPPLNLRIFGVVKNIDFTTIEGAVDYKTVAPAFITPLKVLGTGGISVLKLRETETPLTDFLVDGKTLPPVLNGGFSSIEEALLSNPLFLIVKGGFGTGKKSVIEDFLKKHPDKKVLLFSRHFYKPLSFYFGTLVEHRIENINATYDYIFYFDRHIEKDTMLNLAPFTSNLLIFTYDESVPFEDMIEKNRIFILDKVYGFTRELHRFVSKFYEQHTVPQVDLNEVKIINKENVDKAFIPLVNPEKVVQFVSLKGHVEFEKNKLNRVEGDFTVELVKQFLKGGVERSNIVVIVPYERQKAYIEYDMKNTGITDVLVSLPDEAVRKPIAIVNFVEETLPAIFKDKFMLAYALARGSSKVILVGAPLILKKHFSFYI